MKPLPNAAHLARLAAVAEFEAQAAALDARFAALDFKLQQAQAYSASRRRQVQEAEKQKQRQALRRARLEEGLSVAIFGGTSALFGAAESSRPRLGLPQLPGRR